MSEYPLKNIETHFDVRAARWNRALGSAPLARTFEQLPFLFLLANYLRRDPSELTAVDLLCGNGYLAGAFQGCFRRLVGIDVSAEMFKHHPHGQGVSFIKAGMDEHSHVLRDQVRPDVIVSLAGLHHVYKLVNGVPDPAHSDALQQAAFIAWANSLPSDGVMILADVTAPEDALDYSRNTTPLIRNSGTFVQRYEDLSRRIAEQLGLGGGFSTGFPASVSGYVGAVEGFAPLRANVQPGNWFHKVVDPNGLYGHDDHFPRPKKLISALQKAGFHVDFHELPTPWMFSSMETLVHFFYEKFGLGDEAVRYEDISEKDREIVLKEIEEHLGISKLKEGTVSSGWRLGYYVVTKQAD